MQPGTAIFDEEEGCFKMWYNAQPSRAKPDASPFLCYATSADGVHWDKPELDPGRIRRLEGEQHRIARCELDPLHPQGGRRM